MDELNVLRDMEMSMCDYTLLLQRRDYLERALLSMGRFLDPPARTIYQIWLLGDAKPEDSKYSIRYTPPVIFLWAAAKLRREYG